MPLQLGQVLNDRYQIIAIWGSGGMGSIYRAYDQVMNRFIAVKEHAPDPQASPQAVAEAREALKREARILGGLSHPNLPHTYDYFTFGINEYVVMELVEGQSLEEIAQQFGGALEEWRVRDWAEQVLDALVYIHSRNVIHRDIKPANLILKPDGVVVLVDFGLVKLLDPHSPRTHTGMHGYGTAGYAPVEQFSAGMHTDPRSDLYSFGATLYRLLSGHVPVDVTARLATPGLLPPLRAVNPGVSPQMEWVVVRALEVRAEDRFQSAVEMKQAMLVAPETVSTGTLPVSPPTTPAYQPSAHAQPSLPYVQVVVPRAQKQKKELSGWVWIAVTALALIAIAIWSSVMNEFSRQQAATGARATTTAEYQVTATAAIHATLTANARATALGQTTATAQARATETPQAQATGTAQAQASLTAQAQAAFTAQARATATAFASLPATVIVINNFRQMQDIWVDGQFFLRVELRTTASAQISKGMHTFQVCLRGQKPPFWQCGQPWMRDIQADRTITILDQCFCLQCSCGTPLDSDGK